MNLRRGWLWYLAGLLLAVIAGVVTILALRQALPVAKPDQPARRAVIVARKDIGARQIVSSESVEARALLLEEIPSGAIFQVEDAVGKLSLQDVKAGQPVLAQSLVASTAGAGGAVITSTGALAALLPPDKIGIVLPAGDLLSQSGEINAGDHLDILASINVVDKSGQGGQVTLMHLQNVPIVKVLQEAAVQSQNAQQAQQRPKITGLVLAVDPQDGVILKYFIDANAKVSTDLRSPKLTMSFDVSPVSLDYLADKYKINVPRPLEPR
jgi:Flp pilus assembly protein CpaB